MIVLRIRLDGVTMDHRLERGRATLGSAGRSTIRATTAGWPPLAATLVQSGSEVRMIVPGRVGTVTLRVGDEIKLGRAEVALVGLLPDEGESGAGDTPDAAALASAAVRAAPPARAAAAASSSASPPAPPSTPAFGDYDTPAPKPGAFVLAEAPAPSGAAAKQTAASGVARTPPTVQQPTGAKLAAAGVATDPFSIGARQDFGAELREQLRRAPWVMCSVAFHVLVFLIFSMFRVEMGAVSGGGRMLETSVVPPEMTADTGPEPSEDHAAPEALPDSPQIPDTPARDEDENAPVEEPMVLPGPLAEEEQPVPDAGTQPTISAAGRKAAPRPSTAKSTAPKLDLQETFAKSAVRDATRRAAQHVRDQLGVDRGGPGDALKALQPEDVLVIEGAYDHQERVLVDLGVPHHEISPFDPKLASGAALERPRFLFWNCGDPLNQRLSTKISARVRAFVERGGYLFTSDWSLGNVVIPAFPGYLDTSGQTLPLPEMVLEIAPTRAGTSHKLLDGVFQPGVRGRWWLEKFSHDILVTKPAQVTVLVESPPLRELLNRSASMACTFTYGKGRVLHVLGHYYQEEGNFAGAVAVQRIALNFVLMGLDEKK